MGGGGGDGGGEEGGGGKTNHEFSGIRIKPSETSNTIFIQFIMRNHTIVWELAAEKGTYRIEPCWKLVTEE